MAIAPAILQQLTATTSLPVAGTSTAPVAPQGTATPSLLGGVLGPASFSNASGVAAQAAAQAPQAQVPLTAQDAASLAQIQGPVVTRLPAATAALNVKYANGNYADLPADVLAALKKTDIARVQGGSFPLSRADTLSAAQAASTKKPVTAEKNKSIWDVPGNALADLEGIASSVPRIPGALIREAKRLGDLPGEISKVKSIDDVAHLPVVDLIPGVHTIDELTKGTAGLRDLATHPLSTALDVLPAAKGLAELTPAAKLVEETAQANISAGANPLENRINPLTTTISKKVVTNPETGELELANRAIGRAAQVVKDTRAGQAFQAAFSARSRAISQTIRGGSAEADLQARDVNGDVPSQIAAKFTQLAEPSGATAFKTYGMTKADVADVTQRLQFDPDSISTLPPSHQEYARVVQEGRSQLDQWEQENDFLTKRNDELYTPEATKLIDRRREIFQKRHVAMQDQYTNVIGKYVAPVGFSSKQWADVVNASIAQGGGVDDVLANPNVPTRALPPRLQPLHDTFTAFQEGNATAKDVRAEVTKLKQQRTSLAGSSNVKGASATGEPNSPVTALGSFNKLDKMSEQLAKAEKNLARDVVPARFQPALRAEAERQYIAYRFKDPADITQATELARQGMLKQMDGFSRERAVDPVTGEKFKGLLDFFDDVAPMWQTMKDGGFDPTYVHSVAPEQAVQTFFPKVTEIPKTPAALKARTLDMTPTYRDANLSLAAEAVDFIKQRTSQEVVDKLASQRAIPAAQIEAEFAKRAQADALRDPSTDYDGHLQRLIAKKYRAYDPDTLFNTDRFTASSAPDQYITHVDAKVIHDSYTPKTYNITSTLDPLTGVMRTSLLPLSPRWNLYNIVGGAITGQAISSGKFFTHAPEAWKAVSAMMKGDASLIPEALRDSLGGVKRDELEMQFRSARTIRRMVDEVRGRNPDLEAAAQEGATAGIPQIGAFATARGLAGKLIQKSFDINQRFDDFYRTMGYLDGYDTSGAIAGMSEEGRISYGLQQANSVLQDMNQLTPFELNVLRPIFPFYTYYQHILRYAMKYPIDHPLRVAVTANIARQEVARLGGLPTSFLDVFTWGHPDDQGNQRGLSTSGLNPFADVSNLFTLAGWMGATNPAVKTLLDTAGIDTQNGGPELYPTLGYDPTTGRLTSTSPNPLEGLLFNTIPQSQILGNLIGQGDEYKALLRTNPEAAASLLRTEAGLPLLVRDYNPAQSRIKSELNRQKAAATAKTDALKSGNIGELTQYPSLEPTLKKLAALQQSGQLAQYQPTPTPTPTPQQVALDALSGTVGFKTLPPEQQGAYADQLATLQSTPYTNR